MSRLVPALAALTLAASGLAVAISPADAARSVDSSATATAAPTAAKVGAKTNFGMVASGYGTRVKGGQIPAASGTTAYTSTGCTTRTGKSNSNTEAGVDLQGLGTVGAVDTQLYTEKVDGQIAAVSKHAVANIGLNLGAGTSLSIRAIESTSRAYHDKTGFHATTESNIGKLVLTVAGVPMTLPIPTPNQPIEIPGLLRISISKSVIKEGANGASARAKAVQIDVLATDSSIKVASSYASIEDGVLRGRLGGSANTTRISVLGDLISSGPTLQTLMPCSGTDGKVRTKSAAALDLAGQIVLGAATSSQMGKQTKTRAFGFEQAQVASLTLGPVTIKAITGRVNASRGPGGLQVNSNGTSLGSIVYNGEEQAIPDPGQSLEIPGLVKITPNLVEKIKNGLHVVALQLTLLDGSGAVINIGEAQMRIRNR